MDQRKYKELQDCSNQQLLTYAYKTDVYTEEVVNIALMLLEERDLNTADANYKASLENVAQQRFETQSQHKQWMPFKWALLLNNILLLLVFSLVFLICFIIVPFKEHTAISIGISIVVLALLLIWIIAFNRKRSMALRLLTCINIPLSLLVGAMFLIISFYGGSIMMALIFLGTLAFIIFNNSILTSNGIKAMAKISEQKFQVLFITNIFLGIGTLILLFISFSNI